MILPSISSVIDRGHDELLERPISFAHNRDAQEGRFVNCMMTPGPGTMNTWT
jgi:hypothetical protein